MGDRSIRLCQTILVVGGGRSPAQKYPEIERIAPPVETAEDMETAYH
jgi:hypothetical protein